MVAAMALGLALLACSAPDDTQDTEAQNGVEPTPQVAAAPAATSAPQAPVASPTPYGIAPPQPQVIRVPAATQVAGTVTAAVTPDAQNTPASGGGATAVPTAESTQTPIGDKEQDKGPVMGGDVPITHYQMPEPEEGWPTEEKLDEYTKSNEGRHYPDGAKSYSRSVREDRFFYVYEGTEENRRVKCNADIGTAFDSTNPSWSDKSHLITIWRDGHCTTSTKYRFWKDREKHPLQDARGDFKITRKHEREEFYTEPGEPIDFRTDNTDMDYSLHNAYRFASVRVGTSFDLEDGTKSYCGFGYLPWATWSDFEGFVPIPAEDQQIVEDYLGYETYYGDMIAEQFPDGPYIEREEMIEFKEKARQEGFYYIIRAHDDGEGLSGKLNCWKVVNLDELPPAKPCIWCHKIVSRDK